MLNNCRASLAPKKRIPTCLPSRFSIRTLTIGKSSHVYGNINSPIRRLWGSDVITADPA